jgi:hydrogenase expression/formation protein HypC
MKGDEMCMALPMRVLSVEGLVACCEAKGIEREVNLFQVQHESLRPGDHVLVHAGLAIQKLSEAQAAEAWALFDQILAALESADVAWSAPGVAQLPRAGARS